LAILNPAQNASDHQPRILHGWVAISSYMGVPISTLKDWRADQGFPVMSTGRRRHGYSVMTSTSLIDSWIWGSARAFAVEKKRKR